ncbi:Magnesium dechelatase SGR1, chloroplastic [Linum perenne]
MGKQLLYRDEVVAEWKKVKGKISLHVHCYISGGHFLLELYAKLRYSSSAKNILCSYSICDTTILYSSAAVANGVANTISYNKHAINYGIVP